MAIKPVNCELCISDRDLTDLETRYLQREITTAYVVEQLGCKLYTWRTHINNHVRPAVALQLSQRTEVTDNIVDKIGEVVSGLDDLKEVITMLKKTILSNPDPIMLKTYLQALAELRHYTETLQKLQGEFKDTGKINVQNMHVEYNQLVGKIMQDSCPKCKGVFAESLKDIIKVVPDDSNTT
jgi:hypothetical protein